MAKGAHYDLEERTARFAERCRDFARSLRRTIPNTEYGRQLIRSSGSQAANYIEANESLSRKDFMMRIKICRKETKESCLWLWLCDEIQDYDLKTEQQALLQEAIELRRIFSAILAKSS